MKQIPSPEQVYRQCVTHAVDLFYETLPDDHRRLIEEIAAAEYITVQQLVIKVWATTIARYLQAVAPAPLPEERVEFQAPRQIKRWRTQAPLLMEQPLAEQRKEPHAVKELHLKSDGTGVFPDSTNVNNASSWMPKKR